MKRKLLLLVLITGLLLTACGPTTAPATPPPVGSAPDSKRSPDTDNKYSWSSDSYVPVTTQVYTIEVKVADEIVNHTELNGTGSAVAINGYGSASMRIWQDGKGLLPVKLLSISPAYVGLEPGVFLILKTSDLKAMALPAQSTTKFVCNLDTEVLSPVEDRQLLTTDRITYELDNCRMILPTYNPPQ
jgi:hypothetical protein